MLGKMLIGSLAGRSYSRREFESGALTHLSRTVAALVYNRCAAVPSQHRSRGCLLPGRDVVLFLQHPRTITGLWTQGTWMSAAGPSLDVEQGVVTHTHGGFAQEVIGKSVDQLEQEVS
jgi:hypothetical protein